MVSKKYLYKIASKCLSILRRCILACYALELWLLAHQGTCIHLSAVLGIGNTRNANNNGHMHSGSNSKNLLGCYLVMATFVSMNLILLCLCFNSILAPAIMGGHVALFGTLYTIGNIDRYNNGRNFNNLTTLYSIWLFFMLFATWHAYDLYKSLDSSKRYDSDSRRIENVDQKRVKTAFFILKKWLLGFYAVYFATLGLIFAHEHLSALAQIDKWAEWHVHSRDALLPYPYGQNLYQCYFMMASSVIMICVQISLCYNYIAAPIVLGLHTIVCCCIGCIVLSKNLSPMALAILLSIFLFFGAVAIWFTYDLYKLNTIERSSKSDETNAQYSNDPQRKVSFRNSIHTVMEEGNEVLIEVDEENQTNEKVNAKKFTRECV